ncbi:Store-operated calcium entry-associated regulatory factor [Talaromyces pinophilus]|nr:Store-operated calcium entry-associated regulatory factor [Talaromyces pinophilus]
MKRISSTYLLLLLSLFSTALSETPPSKNAVRLSNVQTLTLHADRETSHRRVSPLPQLKCIGPENVCKLYKIDTMRCTNQGYDYSEEDIQWSCTADLPSEFKLGSTDVICEGYRNADDKWILKGSCGVEYRLLLTEKGEERYGRWRQSNTNEKAKDGDDSKNTVSNFIFAIIIIAVFVFIVIAITGGNNRGGDQGRRLGNNRGGGSGGGGDDDDPPPPYDYQPRSQEKKSNSEGPGFWTGAAAGGAAGGAAGYAMGRRHNDRDRSAGPSYTRRSDYGYRDDPGPAPGPSQSFSPPRSNTGFGSTRRR